MQAVLYVVQAGWEIKKEKPEKSQKGTKEGKWGRRKALSWSCSFKPKRSYLVSENVGKNGCNGSLNSIQQGQWNACQ